ncbi:hypothetical protein B0H14DRAFT_2559781 [Mycena olivaceomarginata]|nr:hypothetical protein B0H14DRAFT_2559781 [Mycena olivaceomarginata]
MPFLLIRYSPYWPAFAIAYGSGFGSFQPSLYAAAAQRQGSGRSPAAARNASAAEWLQRHKCRKQWPRVLDPALNNSVQGYKSSRSTAASKTITVWRWFANVHVKLCPGPASGFAVASTTASGRQRPQRWIALDSIADFPVHTDMDTSRIKTKNNEKGMNSKNVVVERGAVLTMKQNLWCGMVYGGAMREEIEKCCELKSAEVPLRKFAKQ